MGTVTKNEVEELLGCKITDEQLKEALRYAKKKQRYIYHRERRKATLQHWYLVELTAECVRSQAFSKLTSDLCGKLLHMEKEHLIQKNQGAHRDNHIVSVSAL